MEPYKTFWLVNESTTFTFSGDYTHNCTSSFSRLFTPSGPSVTTTSVGYPFWNSPMETTSIRQPWSDVDVRLIKEFNVSRPFKHLFCFIPDKTVEFLLSVKERYSLYQMTTITIITFVLFLLNNLRKITDLGQRGVYSKRLGRDNKWSFLSRGLCH